MQEKKGTPFVFFLNLAFANLKKVLDGIAKKIMHKEAKKIPEIKPKVSIGKLAIRRATEEEMKALDAFISLPLNSAKNLLAKLYKDDHFYETTTYAWVGPVDAKKLFLYGVCKEVLKTCISLMNSREFFQEVPLERAKDSLEKIIFGSIGDEQSYRSRKMIELLALLILFQKKTKKDEEYRIYLSAENLDVSLSQQKDFKTLYAGQAIANVQRSIDDYADRIQKDLDVVGQAPFFLDMNRFSTKKPSVFLSKRTIYLDALQNANDDERLALGISYHATYSRLSVSIHPWIGSHDYGEEDNNFKTIRANFGHIVTLCMHVMRVAYELADEDDPRGMKKIMGENLEKSEAPKYMAVMKKDFQVGDVLLTKWQELVEIVETKEGDFGYKAYKLRFLSRPPLPECPEDWRRAENILIKLVGKDSARAMYEQSMRSVEDEELDSVMGEVMKQSDEWLLECAKGMYLDMHNAKVLVPMLLSNGSLKKTETEEPEEKAK
ncbi:MAG: hypothetical protein IPJ67_05165 [Candidatus Moraniibacteriota bacterium]|nr:MAG: hypothetical protein IPJ67_05165 [Candidatus Moranbacteria bacterium]